MKYIAIIASILTLSLFVSCGNEPADQNQQQNFPIGSIVEVDGESYVVIGFEEGVSGKNYRSISTEDYICGEAGKNNIDGFSPENAILLKDSFDDASLRDFFYKYLKVGSIINFTVLDASGSYESGTASIVSIETDKIKLLLIGKGDNGESYFQTFSKEEFLRGYFWNKSRSSWGK